jgi:hypothetical protein
VILHKRNGFCRFKNGQESEDDEHSRRGSTSRTRETAQQEVLNIQNQRTSTAGGPQHPEPEKQHSRRSSTSRTRETAQQEVLNIQNQRNRLKSVPTDLI